MSKFLVLMERHYVDRAKWTSPQGSSIWIAWIVEAEGNTQAAELVWKWEGRNILCSSLAGVNEIHLGVAPIQGTSERPAATNFTQVRVWRAEPEPSQITMICKRCEKSEPFQGETDDATWVKACRAGWTFREHGLYCQACADALAQEQGDGENDA